MIKYFVVLVSTIFLLVVPSIVQAGGSSISFGTVDLKTGMQEDVVIAELNKLYDLEKLTGSAKDSSSWVIKSKVQKSQFYGSISFKNGKLASVMRYWSPDDQQKGYEFAKAIYGLVAQFEKEGNSMCRISVGENNAPQFQAKAAFIVCGPKAMRVDIVEGKGTRSGSISEVLGE